MLGVEAEQTATTQREAGAAPSARSGGGGGGGATHAASPSEGAEVDGSAAADGGGAGEDGPMVPSSSLRTSASRFTALCSGVLADGQPDDDRRRMCRLAHVDQLLSMGRALDPSAAIAERCVLTLTLTLT